VRRRCRSIGGHIIYLHRWSGRAAAHGSFYTNDKRDPSKSTEAPDSNDNATGRRIEGDRVSALPTREAVTVMCFHGLGRSARDWNGVRSGLARHGDVRAAELPRGDLSVLMAAAAELPEPAILIGHSMAGVLALRLAAAAPHGVRGVVLTDSFFPPSRNGRGIAATGRDYGAHRLVLAREMVARRSSVRPSRASALGLGSLARLGLRPEAFHKAAAGVRAPVLVVHARDDHYVPVDFALSAARRHPAWTVKVIDAGGHNAHVDRPDAWLAATETWLSELTI